MVVAVALLLSPVVSTDALFAAQRTNSSVNVKPGSLTGKITDVMGDAMGHLTIQVLNTKGEQFVATRTDATGKFALEGITEGTYTVLIGANVKVGINVTDQATLSELVFMIPSTKPYSAGNYPDEGPLELIIDLVPIGLGAAALIITLDNNDTLDDLQAELERLQRQMDDIQDQIDNIRVSP